MGALGSMASLVVVAQTLGVADMRVDPALREGGGGGGEIQALMEQTHGTSQMHRTVESDRPEAPAP